MLIARWVKKIRRLKQNKKVTKTLTWQRNKNFVIKFFSPRICLKYFLATCDLVIKCSDSYQFRLFQYKMALTNDIFDANSQTKKNGAFIYRDTPKLSGVLDDVISNWRFVSIMRWKKCRSFIVRIKETLVKHFIRKNCYNAYTNYVQTEKSLRAFAITVKPGQAFPSLTN